MIESQLGYFKALNDGAPGLVSVLDSISAQEVANFIAVDALTLQGQGYDSGIFEKMCELVHAEQN